MLLAGERQGCLTEMLVIVSGLSVQDPRERPADQQQAADAAHRRFWAPATGGTDADAAPAGDPTPNAKDAQQKDAQQKDAQQKDAQQKDAQQKEAPGIRGQRLPGPASVVGLPERPAARAVRQRVPTDVPG